MLGSEDHVGRTEKGVRACGENGDLFLTILDGKTDLGTFTPADPVFLQELDALWPIETIQALD